MYLLLFYYQWRRKCNVIARCSYDQTFVKTISEYAHALLLVDLQLELIRRPQQDQNFLYRLR